MESAGLVVLSSLLSGIVGVLVSTRAYLQSERRRVKLDVFRRLAASRYALVTAATTERSQGDFFSALNECFIVFHDAPAVQAALLTLHADMDRTERTKDNLVRLFKAMTEHLKISHGGLTDSFFLKPFGPGKGLKPPTSIG
jgi:hypothetical protein